jgi:predicted DNA-binding ribbon-helix-helix protein
MNHSGALGYNRSMAGRTASFPRKRGGKALRQSVSIPEPLAAEVRRVARERRLTVSRALVTLAERGVRAEEDAKQNLRTAYRRFLKEQDPSKKEEAGRDLIRAVFGKDSIAEDPLL